MRATRRQGLLVFVVVSFLTFIEAHLLPGNPARAILGIHASAAQVRAFDIENGYNHAMPVQYMDYADRLFAREPRLLLSAQSERRGAAQRAAAGHGDPGRAIGPGRPARHRAGRGTQAVRRNKPVDYAITGTSFALYSMPQFWLGLMLILLFAEKVRLFPPTAPQGNVATSSRTPRAGAPSRDARARQRGRIQPVPAVIAAGQPRQGICAHGTSQGRLAARRPVRPRVSQRAGTDHHPDRPEPAGNPRRCPDHRDRFQLPGNRPAVLELGAVARITR